MRDVGSADETARAAIPRALLVIKDFVNTVDLTAGVDEFDSPAALGRWLHAHDLGTTRVSTTDLTMAISLREGLRQLLLVHAGHEPLPQVLDAFNDALGSVPLVPRFTAAGEQVWIPVRRSALASVVVALVERIAEAQQDQSWTRLKACASADCQWAYYDASRNRSGRWCSMIDCGNRVKMRRAYTARTSRTAQS